MRGRVRSIDIALGSLLLLAVLAAVGVAFVRVYPEAARRIGLDVISWSPGLARPVGSTASAVSDGVTMVGARWEARVLGPIEALFAEESTTGPEPGAAGFPADSCLECHPYYESRPLFSVVYSPHQTHAAEGVPCERCHAASGPARDRVPQMAGCAECHAITGRENCGVCHPPGSLFHGSELAGERELGFECGVCHNEERLRAGARAHDMPRYSTDPASCVPCHDAERFCSSCHPAAHDPGYTRRHAADLRQARRSHTECWACHDARWCAERCHSGR